MRATTAPGEGNLVQLTVEIDEPELDKALDGVMRRLSQQVRVPGFRPGKVPRQVLEARLGGAAALRADALREVLPDFYAQAVIEADLDPIAPPELDITAGEESGAVTFGAVVQVRPIVAIPGYAGLRVTVPAVEPTDEEIEVQVDRLREAEGELRDVERPVADGDHVTVDLEGLDDQGQSVVLVEDYLYEVGSSRVVPELDQSLAGAEAGAELTFTATPEAPAEGEEADPDAPAPRPVTFTVRLKDIKEKVLPEPTDEWAAESSEFSTIAELRQDVAGRIRRVKRYQAQQAMREGTMEALVTLVDEAEVPEVLVDEEVGQRLDDLQRRLKDQRVDLGQFLAATGRSTDELVAEFRVEAARSVKADLALRALAEAEAIEVSQEELDREIAETAERMEIGAEQLRARLDHTGRMAAVRSEQRKGKALDWLLEHVELVDGEEHPVSRADVMGEDGADSEVTAGGEPPAEEAATEETES